MSNSRVNLHIRIPRKLILASIAMSIEIVRSDWDIMKQYPESIGLQEIWSHFEGFPLAHLATIDGHQPRVRSMALVSFDDRLWLATKIE